MPTDKLVRIVRRALGTFMRTGSYKQLLESMTDDIVLKASFPPGIASSTEFSGKTGVTAYFTLVNSLVELLEVNVTDFITGNNKVVMLGTERLRGRRSGREGTLDFASVFIFRDDRIEKLLAFEDLSSIVDPASQVNGAFVGSPSSERP